MRAHTPRSHTQHPQSRSIVSTLSHASTVRILSHRPYASTVSTLLLNVIKCCMMRAPTPRFHTQHPQSRSIVSTLSHASTVRILSHTPYASTVSTLLLNVKVLHDACSHTTLPHAAPSVTLHSQHPQSRFHSQNPQSHTTPPQSAPYYFM